MRGSPPARELLRGLLEADELLLASEIVRFELLAGVRPGDEPSLEDFFGCVAWVSVDERVSRTAAALARRYRSAFSGIDDADYLIAATAIVLNAELATTNVRHFPMFPDLQPPY